MYNYLNINEELRVAKTAPKIKLKPQPIDLYLEHVNYTHMCQLHTNTYICRIKNLEEISKCEQ